MDGNGQGARLIPGSKPALWLAGILAGLHFVLGLTWPVEGWNGFRYWSATGLRLLPTPILALIAVLAVAAPVIVIRSSVRSRSRTSVNGRDRWLLLSSLGAAIGLATVFRVRHGYLGDNWLRVREAMEGAGNENERGAIAFLHQMSSWTGESSLEHVAETFRTVGLVAGVAYVLLFVLAGSILRLDPLEKKALTFLAILSGVFLVFCGYLELYGLVLPLVLLVVVLALHGAGDRRWAWAGLFSVFAVSFVHKLALLWIPAAVVPVLLTVPRVGEALRNASGRTLLGVTTLLLVAGFGAAAWLSRTTTLLLRWAPRDDRPYAIFSPSHLTDFTNAQWVGSAGGLFLGLWGLFWLARQPKAEGETWIALWAWLLPAGALFVFNPVLGGADWDVLALASPFALLFAYSLGLNVRSDRTSAGNGDGTSGGAGTFRRAVWPAALGLSIAVTLPWLFLQRSEVSTDWFGQLIRGDAADYYQTHPPDLHLAFVYASNGQDEARRDALERGRTASPNDPRVPLALARFAIEQDNWEEAEARALEAYGIVRGYLPALDILYEAFRRSGRTEDQQGAGTVILKAHESEPAEVERFLPRVRIEEIRTDLSRLESGSSPSTSPGTSPGTSSGSSSGASPDSSPGTSSR